MTKPFKRIIVIGFGFIVCAVLLTMTLTRKVNYANNLAIVRKSSDEVLIFDKSSAYWYELDMKSRMIHLSDSPKFSITAFGRTILFGEMLKATQGMTDDWNFTLTVRPKERGYTYSWLEFGKKDPNILAVDSQDLP